jgi:hypothetical protein
MSPLITMGGGAMSVDQRLIPVVVSIKIADRPLRELVTIIPDGSSELAVALHLAGKLRDLADMLIEELEGGQP